MKQASRTRTSRINPATAATALAFATAFTAAAAVAAATAPAAIAAPNPATVTNPMHAHGRTQVSVDHTHTGLHVGTPNENEARYSLSLTKLLLADFVFEHGAPADKAKAHEMIVHSNDGLASELAGRYPQAIGAKAGQYHLNSAVPASTWGNWRFSSADWSRYLSAKLREDPTGTGPLLSAMRMSAPQGADGYNQRYGVALLPGVQGWKSGWSDDRSTFHASAGFGNGWTVAVQTNGTAGDLNHDLIQALNSGQGIPAPQGPVGSLDTVNYPARAAAQASVNSTVAWVNNTIGGMDPQAAQAISGSIAHSSAPVVNAVPASIPMPQFLAQALPRV